MAQKPSVTEFRVASLFCRGYAEGLWFAEIASGTKVAATIANEGIISCRSPEIARAVIGSNYLAFHGDPRFHDLIRRAGLPK